jgi:hypothetical protein
MNYGMITLLALAAAPLTAWAHSNPDFDDDAKPILRMQPGLLQYVEQRFEVKDTGTAKYPGDDDRRPSPPYIFRARPAGTEGPYNLRLLIQPGQPGHILGVVDITRVHLNGPQPQGPSTANQPPEPAERPQPSAQIPALSAPAPAETQAPAENQAPAPTQQQPSEPTADTPSGPITDSGAPTSNSSQPSLQPPPDPAPASH